MTECKLPDNWWLVMETLYFGARTAYGAVPRDAQRREFIQHYFRSREYLMDGAIYC